MNSFHGSPPLSTDKGILLHRSFLDHKAPANVTHGRGVISWLLLILLLSAGPNLARARPYAGDGIGATAGLIQAPISSAPAGSTWPLRAAAIARALDWLHTQQQPDGSFGVRTADAVFLIARAGEKPDGPAWRPADLSALDALAGQIPAYLTDAGRTAKFLRAVAAAGRDVHNFAGVDLAARLVAYYQPATGLYHPGHLYYHTLAVQSLRLAALPAPPPAVDAIIAQQHSTGGWEWRIGGPLDEVDTTGLILETLPLAAVPVSSTTIISAVNFLAATQHSDGGWSLNADGATNSNSTALALAGLLAAQRDPLSAPFVQGAHTPLSALLALQAADGGFNFTSAAAGERLMTTLDALDALLRPYPGDVLPPPRLFAPFTPY